MSRPTTVRSNGTKPCTCCKEVRLLDRFYTTGKKKDGAPKYNSWCKDCVAAKQASYHKKLGGLTSCNLQRGGDCISVDALETLWFAQGGLCAATAWPAAAIELQFSLITNIDH